MSDDVGGRPFPGEDPDGEEPEFHHAAADDEFATVVLNEDFVRSAAVHEPTAAERILAAAQSHAEAEAARGFEDGYGYGPGQEGEFDPDAEAEADEGPDDEGRFDRSDYSGYAEFPDGDESVPYGPYSTFGQHAPYGPHNSYAEYADYTAYTMRIDAADEHGSDYRYPYRGAHAASRRYRGHSRWQRPVAWVLAVVMGIGMVALALSAVYRGASGSRQDPAPPPATTGVDATDSGHAHVKGRAQLKGRAGVPAPPRGQYAAPPSLTAPVSAAGSAASTEPGAR